MILDALNTFAEGQAITSGTAVSTNVIDTGIDVDTFNAGGLDPAFLVIKASDAFVGGTSVTAELISDDTSAMSSPTVHASTGAIPTAALADGAHVAVLPLPYGEYERYVAVRFVAAGTFTGGTVDAYLTRTPNFWRALPAHNPAAN